MPISPWQVRVAAALGQTRRSLVASCGNPAIPGKAVLDKVEKDAKRVAASGGEIASPTCWGWPLAGWCPLLGETF